MWCAESFLALSKGVTVATSELYKFTMEISERNLHCDYQGAS